MKTTGWACVVGVLAGSFGFSGPAQACPDPPYYTVIGHAPTDDAVPLNAPIEIQLHGEASHAGQTLLPSLTLTKSGDDQPLEVQTLLSLPNLGWVPLDPLEPKTNYEVHDNSGYEGIPDTIWQFTTGSETRAALSLEGKLEATLEPGVDVVFDCPSGCTGECFDDCVAACTSQEVAATKARVKLPRALDGFATRSGELWLTDDAPYEFEKPSNASEPYQGRNVSVVRYADLEKGGDTELLITVPDEEKPYRPCLAFAATDARGDRAFAEPLCLDQLFPLSDGAGGEGGADDGGAENAAGGEASPIDPVAHKIENKSSSCSFGPSRAGASVWLGALGLLLLARKQRARRLD